MCLRLPVNRQGILASQGDSYGRRAVEGIQLLPQGKTPLIEISVLFCFLLRFGMEIAARFQQTKAVTRKPLISATSKSHMPSEIQRGKIIPGCTFVLIKGITPFRATAAYE